VLAPMPRASDRIATVANSGLRRSPRIARRRSDSELVTWCLDGLMTVKVGARAGFSDNTRASKPFRVDGVSSVWRSL
jgi:hypothetical protein